MAMNLLNSTILLTGGTGSFGNFLVKHLLSNEKFTGTIRILSRNESKQLALRQQFKNHASLRFLIGDVRDFERTLMAVRGVDILIHAAAMNQISALEYNPFEAINTNILGTQHIIRAAIEAKVKKAILLSSGEVCYPNNLSGATKLTAEKLFIQSNFYTNRKPKLSVLRFSNIANTPEDIISMFESQQKNSTCFLGTPKQIINFIYTSIETMQGGEIFVPKLYSVKLSDVLKTVTPQTKAIVQSTEENIIHEILITKEEMKQVTELKSSFVIWPKSSFWSKSKKPDTTTKKKHILYSSETDNHPITTQFLEQFQ